MRLQVGLVTWVCVAAVVTLDGVDAFGGAGQSQRNPPTIHARVNTVDRGPIDSQDGPLAGDVNLIGSTAAGMPTQASGIAACCLPDGSCLELTEADCLVGGGYYLPGTPDCTGGVCDLGSCCYFPADHNTGFCDDGFGQGIPISQCDTAGAGTVSRPAATTNDS